VYAPNLGMAVLVMDIVDVLPKDFYKFQVQAHMLVEYLAAVALVAVIWAEWDKYVLVGNLINICKHMYKNKKATQCVAFFIY
jgi:hypothetical protein